MATAVPEVVVVGAGPVGTLLSAELARLGVDVAVVERRAVPGAGSRAIGLHAPTLTALEAGGAADRILERAVTVRRGEARSDGRLLGTVRFDQLRARHPYVATLPQAETEAALAVGAPTPERGVSVERIRPDGERMRLHVRSTSSGSGGEREVDAAIVIVAAGVAARSLVFRDAALARTSYPDRYLMTDAVVPPFRDATRRNATGPSRRAADATDPSRRAGDATDTAVVHLAATGVLESFPLPGGRRRFVAWDAGGADDAASRLVRLRAALRERGEAAAADVITDATGFTVRRVLAPAMRRGRLFAIGDTAHEISPIGGQGMNLGLLDAASLAPLLAYWVHTGEAPEAELDRWHRDRLRSARAAGRLAAVNMRLGRPVSAAAHAVRIRALGAVLGATGPLLAHAYAMGFDAAHR